MSQTHHKDLVASHIARQNVLNNPFALQKLQDDLGIEGLFFRNEFVFTKRQVAQLLDIEERTVERYITEYSKELKYNGYRVIKGADLAEFMQQFVTDINVGHKARSLSLFGFRTVLNLAMLTVESEQARLIRARILDIVIDVMSQRTGGQTKYINQRDPEYLGSAYQEENFRKKFTTAVDRYIAASGPWKYGRYTNLIYKAIFKENAEEYKTLLCLSQKDKVRDTLYADVLDTIASFEGGFAEALEQEHNRLERPLTLTEADALFKGFSEQALYQPFYHRARTIMASRDLHFRDVTHYNLEEYIRALPEGDFERFLGEKSKSLQDRIDESLDVYKRLRDR